MSRPSSVRLDIQGLRAIAVLLVIANHVFGMPGGGFVGVDVFFVISGFIITSMLLKEYDRTRTINFKQFYLRRIKRILPAAMLVLIATVFAAALLLPLERATSAATDAIWATFFAANWRMLATNVDYFAQDLSPSPLQHYWSLSIEEQFYFLWPWLMLGVLLFARRRFHTRGLGKKILLWVIGLISVVSLAWSIFETSTAPAAAYFSSFSRFWELGVGAVAAIALVVINWRMSAVVAAVLAYSGLGLIAASTIVLTEHTPFPGVAALLPVTGALLVVLAGHGAPASYSRALVPLTNPVAVYIGNLSYSLYLWHMPFVVICLALVPVGPLYFGIVLVGTAALSVLTYHYVENPIRFSSWPSASYSMSNKSKLVALTASVTLAAFALGSAFILQTRQHDATLIAAAENSAARTSVNESQAGTAEQDAAADVERRCRGAGSLEPANQPCDLSSLPLRPSLTAIEQDRGGPEDQACWRGEGEEPKTCRFGADDSEAPRIALIGDSHAYMFLPAMRLLAEERGYSVTSFVGWGCQWAVGGDCAAQTALANSEFADGSFDVIVNFASRRVTSTWSDEKVASTREMVEAVAPTGAKVLHIEDVPLPSEESLLCIQRPGFDPLTTSCGTPRNEALAQEDRYAEAVSPLEHVAVANLNDLICISDFCPSVIGQTVTFRDTAGHLTVSYANTLRGRIDSYITELLSPGA